MVQQHRKPSANAAAMAVARPSSFDISVPDLQRLMEARGAASIKFLKERYGGIQGLCKTLKTSTHDGECDTLLFLTLLRSE